MARVVGGFEFRYKLNWGDSRWRMGEGKVTLQGDFACALYLHAHLERLLGLEGDARLFVLR